MDMIRIDYFGFSGSFDDWLYEKYEFTSTGAFSSAFYTMGYSSRNVISNVGPINFIAVVFLSTVAFFQIICLPKSCKFFECSKKIATRVKKL